MLDSETIHLLSATLGGDLAALPVLIDRLKETGDGRWGMLTVIVHRLWEDARRVDIRRDDPDWPMWEESRRKSRGKTWHRFVERLRALFAPEIAGSLPTAEEMREVAEMLALRRMRREEEESRRLREQGKSALQALIEVAKAIDRASGGTP